MSEETPETAISSPTSETTEVSTSLGAEFLNNFSKENQEILQAKNIGNMDDMVKKMVNAESLVGKDKVVLINEKSSPEEVAAYKSKMNIPVDAASYKMPEDISVDDATKDKMFGKFHELNLNEQQGAGMLRLYHDAVAEGKTAQGEKADANKAAVLASLQKEWQGDVYAEKMAHAKTFAAKFGGEGVFEELDASGLGNNEALIKLFASAGQALASDQVIGTGKSSGSFGLGKSEAAARLSAMKQDPATMRRVMRSSEPGHKEAYAEYTKLMQVANPE